MTIIVFNYTNYINNIRVGNTRMKVQRYKSIFKESENDIANTVDEAESSVNISSLQWSKSNGGRLYTWDQAKENIPSGYRLPTIQELVAAHSKRLKGFTVKGAGNLPYWSSTKTDKGTVWFQNFAGAFPQIMNPKQRMFVRYVKE